MNEMQRIAPNHPIRKRFVSIVLLKELCARVLFVINNSIIIIAVAAAIRIEIILAVVVIITAVNQGRSVWVAVKDPGLCCFFPAAATIIIVIADAMTLLLVIYCVAIVILLGCCLLLLLMIGVSCCIGVHVPCRIHCQGKRAHCFDRFFELVHCQGQVVDRAVDHAEFVRDLVACFFG